MDRVRRLLRCATLLLLAALASPAPAAQRVIDGPDDGTRRFGAGVQSLPNGNFLVYDPDWTPDVDTPQAGAVYLYDADANLISRLTGRLGGDRVGSGGVTLLADGNFVISSPSWRASALIDAAGAVTFGNADTGFGAASVEVGAGNSLVGSSSEDRIGGDGVFALPNGAYVVASGDWDRAGVGADAGAVTWCAADGSTVGPIDAGNSLVGARAQDHSGGLTLTGRPGVIVLDGGDYVITTPRWDRAALADVGAVTWAARDGSTTGEVGAGNSLVGVRAGDAIGTEVQALRNGHYIVQSPFWRSATVASAGAVTWADGSAPTLGEVDETNSLVGSQTGDLVGYLAAPLANGHYVVASPLWNRGAIADTGAITWRDGGAPHPGVVDESNSLVGSHADDNLGFFTTIGLPPLGVIALDDGDYVVASPEWDGENAVNAGAVTWGDGEAGVSGPLSPANSIVGSHAGDQVGTFVLTLPGGRYVAGSPYWWQRRGAATWGDGAGAPVGAIDAGNSLVGTQPDDYVSASGLYPLPGGAYVVASERWSHADTLRVGAVTRAGASGITGEVSPANSLIGVALNDQVGRGGIEALPDGDYVVRSSLAGAGALTRVGGGHVNPVGTVTAANSMTGIAGEDAIGLPGPTAFADGALLQHTAAGAADEAGAITLFDPSEPYRGTLPEAATVRSAVAQGGAGLTWAYLPAQRSAIVGDGFANRVVMLSQDRLFRDGFD